MSMQERANCDSQEKSFGEISDQHLQQPQDERKAVQKRTFTRWLNLFLQRCDPPVEVHDLFTDIQDGRILMALLEELSGCKLLYRFRSSSHRIFRLNNISKALAFLDDRHVKLLGIDASGIADGIPSVVLNLVWNIILHFQVKEVARSLQRHLSSSLSSLSMSSYSSFSDLSPPPNDIGCYSCNTLPSKGRKAARKPKYHGKAIKTLLQWVQRCTSKFGVEVYDFGKSWRSGLAFLAVIKYVNPDLVDLRESLSREPRENIKQAFMIAHHSLDITPLLEPEDVAHSSPDEQSIITYVSLFLGHCSGMDEDHTTNIEVPEIPNFGSLESVGFGEILTDETEAQALLRGLEKSSEQLLWKRWSRRSSGGTRTTSLYTNGTVASGDSSSESDISAAISQFNKKRGRSRSILQPPSPLDAGVVSQEIRSWLEKGLDQAYSKPRVDENHFSLSSEEGIYSLSTLDSDEEDAYSYILDLNKEVFQPYNQLKRQVLSVKEETAEEMNEESKNPEMCEILNGSGGCKLQEGSVVQNADFDLESEVGSQSVVHRRFDLDQNESSFRDMTHNRPVFDTVPEDESSRKEEEERVRNQINDYGEEESETEEVENVRLVTHGYDKTEALVDEAEKAKIFETPSWQNDVEKDTDRGLSVRCVQVSEERVIDKEEEENLTAFEEGQDRQLGKGVGEEDNIKREEGSGVGVNEKIFIDEVQGVGAAGGHSEEGNDRKHIVPRMEDLTKNCKDEDTEEYTGAVANSKDFVAVDEKDGGLKIKKRKLTAKKVTTIDHLGETTPKNDTDRVVNIRAGEDSWTSACSATSQSFSEEGFIQSLAASCDITPLELEMLLALWILFYCCLILPQMNL
ncbi:calmin-like isoform X2 [Seriola dumerili]|uniref:calmin-like isoform X2 n=1 Tax=Seriola dumerili TaxID=41447 RepID=UPI000BBEE97D|nr:calmin-like isoform X2 [Seriola dumerili]